MLPTVIVAYLALFASVGFLFVFACLLLGRFMRAHAPTASKLDTYECGEPSIGPGTVQFDLRFYVVALLFLIFEVEVVMFFPPATIFGQATRMLASEQMVPAADTRPVDELDELEVAAKIDAADVEIDAVEIETAEEEEAETADRPAKMAATAGCGASSARALAFVAMIDMGVFFAVLLVGFAYLWRRGDLDWVRAVRHPATSGETAALAARLYRDDY